MPPRDRPGLGARREAVRLVSGVLRRGRPLDDAGEALPDARDRALARAIAATTLRRLGAIEAALRPLLAKPLPRKSGAAREILLAAAAQILFLRVPAHAAIDTAVALAREDRDARHFAGLVNAVLRRLAEASPADHDPSLDTPPWLAARWRAAYGDATFRAIAAAHGEDPPLDLSVRHDPERWAERLGGIVLPTGSVRVPDRPGAIESWPGYEEGDWWVQDAAAALPARLFGDVRGRRVLDLCAAPGGKTAQLAAAGADVTAVDRSEARLDRLRANLARLRLEATVVSADAEAYEAPPFDAVLLDAPCSATGTIRRHPDVPHLKQPADIVALAALQRRLIDHAAGLVTPGGVLVYATCSLEPEEAEHQAAAFLARDPRFARQPIRPEEVGGQAHLLAPDGDLRTLPCHPIGPAHGLDGFFAARFHRV